MARQLIDRARGFVHDIDTVAALSDVASNIRLLSDRSLYILQNLSGEDVTFLSRYGEIETGGFYLPVQEGSPEAETVYDAINLIRRDLNDMTVETALECICEQLESIAASISAAQGESATCTIGSDVETSDGTEGGPLPDPVNGIDYDPPSAIIDRKCKAANYIHGSISEVVTELKLNRADQYLFAGLAFVLALVTTIVGGLILGPFGLLLGAVSGSFLSMATLLFKASFSLALLETAILADQDAAICALFEATSASGARTAYLAHLTAEGATALEIEFVEFFLTNNLLNVLFFAWGDSEDVIDATPIISDCSSCVSILEDWDFVAGLEGWTYTDTSVPPETAVMAWNAGTEALRNTHTIAGAPVGTTAIEDHSPVISHPSVGNQEVEVQYGAPSDAIVTSNAIVVEFLGSPDEVFGAPPITVPTTRIESITTIDTITGITVRTGRTDAGPTVFTIDIERVILRSV